MGKIGPLSMLLASVAVFFWLTPAEGEKKAGKEISPAALQQLLSQDSGLMLINTMSGIECRDHAIPKSVCIPCETFEKNTDRLPRDKNRKLVYYCESDLCLRSYKSAAKAIERGYGDVSVLKGGLPGWKMAGYAVVARERIPRTAIPSLKPALLRKRIEEGNPPFIIDIRSEDAFRQESIKGAVNIPFYRLDEEYQNLPRDRQLLIVDERGFRSFLAACYLERKGFATTRLFGGMERWQKSLAATKRQPDGNRK